MVDLAEGDQEQGKSPLRRALTWIRKAVKDKKVLALLGIIALGAYLRLWNLHHLFNAIHDYDEGAYSLGARFISQGYMPYQDFTLVHPPLYSLTLASIYRIFGYDFFYSKYLSVALSLASIVLIYIVGKKMYHSGTGLIAAALFAVSPVMVYFGRRAVQESMGIFFIVLGIYFAFNFLDNHKSNRLLFCGLSLGMAVATKYTFIPAVAAIAVAIVFLSMGNRFWRSIKSLGSLSFWITYVCLATISFALLLLLRWTLHLSVSLPFFEPMYFSIVNTAVTMFVFVLPFVASWAMLKSHVPYKEWWARLWGLRRTGALWLVPAGAILAFIAVTGFFWIKAPQELVFQTLLLQGDRPYVEFPSLAAMIRITPLASGFLKMAFLPLLLALPLAIVLLNKRKFSVYTCFVSVALLSSLVLSQGFYHMPKYYISLYPFLFLGVSLLVPQLNTKMLTGSLQSLGPGIKANLLVVFTSLFLLISLSIILLTNYTGYDINWPWFASNEEHVYGETIDYLEEAGAKKVYAVNPIFPALSQNLDSTLDFDSFALLWLEKKPPAELIREKIDEGVDYVVIDSWLRYWRAPYREQTMALAQETRRNGRLVRVIAPDSLIRTEIYALGIERQGIFNGQFDHWVNSEEISLPLGWKPVAVTGDGDTATIAKVSIADVTGAGFTAFEDGLPDEVQDSTHAGISQEILFPDTNLRVRIFPTANTTTTGHTVLGPAIHFVDDNENAVVFGFSNEINEEKVTQYHGGNRTLVLKNAPLNQWSEQTIDLSRYWLETGWRQPEKITIFLVVSTDYTEPGYHSFYVADMETGNAGQTE